jgi:phosphoribosyl-AMP cyclohydrolase
MSPQTPQLSWIEQVKFDGDGLVPAIAQDHASGQVLMVAWMNAQALEQTARLGQAVYWSRSRQKLWHKGESSGHTQRVVEMRLDCDADVILLKVEQIGHIACHTGRQSCFYLQLLNKDGTMVWEAVDPVLKDPELIYK